MATSSRGAHLHSLLNSLELANKQDCIDFSMGHLNENNLLKIGEKSSNTHRSWSSAHKPQIRLTPRSQVVKGSGTDKTNLPMGDALLKFSIGTGATIPGPPDSKKPVKQRSDLKKKTQRQESYIDDGILVEEFKGRDPISEYLEMSGEFSPRVPVSLAPLPSMPIAITKRDHFLQKQIYEHDVLRKQDARETNVLSGFKAVRHHEKRLQRGLDQLRYPGHAPSFHRLQVYSSVFEDLISESSTMGPVLKNIKKEYDDYMTLLLDNNPQQHKLLAEQIQQLRERKLQAENQVDNERKKLNDLEKEAEILLIENQELRSQLIKERQENEKPQDLFVEIKKDNEPTKKVATQDLANHIQGLRATILEKLDEMQEIRTDLRENYVPTSVIKQMENCVKDTEVKNQRLTRKNELHDEAVEEKVKGLEEEIEKADTSESDERRIWRRLLPRGSTDRTSSKSHSHSDVTVTSTQRLFTPTTRKTPTDDQSESENEDEYKWDWYIS